MYLGTTTSRITIAGKYVLLGVNAIEIKRSVHQVIQTAKVTLPLSVVMRNTGITQRIKLIDKIKEGDTIKLEFGYDGKNQLEFEGYIRRINDGLPLVLECEDELWPLRKIHFKESFKTISLRKLVELVVHKYAEQTGMELKLYDKMPQVELTKYQLNNKNGIAVLQDLKEYLACCYLTQINGIKTLYAGLAYSLQRETVKYELGRNTIGKGELKYTGADDMAYKITIKNIRNDGTVKKIEKGEDGGYSKEVKMHGNLSDSELQLLAEKELLRMKTAGYKGSFETFLFPFAEPGTVAQITDPQYAGRSGRYYVGTVTTTFGVGGGRRKLEIDLKVSNG